MSEPETLDAKQLQLQLEAVTRERDELQTRLAAVEAQRDELRASLIALMPLAVPLTAEDVREMDEHGLTFEELIQELEQAAESEA